MTALFRRHWRDLAAFALLFRMVESLLLAPAAALAGKWLLGRTVLDSTAVVSFLLSPRGIAALLLATTTAVGLRLFEHAGLSAIFFGAGEGRRITGRVALRLVGRRLAALAGVAARFVGVALVTMLPLLSVAGIFAARLLPRHDINYYLKLRPPEFIAAAAAIGFVALATLAVLLALVVRWRWAVQAVLFQRRGPGAAFTESAALTRGVRWRVAGAVAGVSLAALALGLAGALAGDAVTRAVLAALGGGAVSLAVSFGVLLALRTVIGAVATFLGSCLDAGMFTALFRARAAALGRQPDLTTGEDSASRAAPSRWLPAALATGLLLFAGGAAALALGALADERPVTIHAHRGVTTRAPENTLGAARDAITAGADHLETDVQVSRDGVPVVAHDSDFSRLGGVAKRVWELTAEEIRAIPLGGGEVTPTFDELLAETKGRIRVNIELKYYGGHQPGLAEKVIAAVRARGMLDQVVVQCLEYEPLLEVRRLAPGVPVGYLLSFNASEPARLEVDFLSVEQGRLDRAFVQRAHRRGRQVLAWTVNTAEDMRRLCDLGVDGVITDEPALARKTLAEHLARPGPERALRRVRAWLAD